MTFFYSAYWSTWSRRLGYTRKGVIIELNLTPINPQFPESWERMRDEIIRAHGTGKDRRDREVDKLPEDVVEEMKRRLGENLTWRLLGHDYTAGCPMEDMDEAVRRNPGRGGVPYREMPKSMYFVADHKGRMLGHEHNRLSCAIAVAKPFRTEDLVVWRRNSWGEVRFVRALND